MVRSGLGSDVAFGVWHRRSLGRRDWRAIKWRCDRRRFVLVVDKAVQGIPGYPKRRKRQETSDAKEGQDTPDDPEG